MTTVLNDIKSIDELIENLFRQTGNEFITKKFAKVFPRQLLLFSLPNFALLIFDPLVLSVSKSWHYSPLKMLLELAEKSLSLRLEFLDLVV